MHRRSFLKTPLWLAPAALGSAHCAVAKNKTEDPTAGTYRDTGPLLNAWKYLKEPVVIAGVELLRTDKEKYYVRVKSADGAECTVYATNRLRYSVEMFKEMVAPVFVNEDARELERLVDLAYRSERNYKFAGGMNFWFCIGNIELAILGLLGRRAGVPVWKLFADTKVRDRFGVYYTTFDRENTAEKYIDDVQKVVADYNFRCVKLKVGGRMSKNTDCLPGRTEKLIPLARKTFGDDFTLYVDCNGSFDARRGTEVARLCQDWGVAILEEPTPFHEFQETKLVNDAVKIPIAGGEQDNSFPMFRHYAESKTLDVLQPDFEYNGGFIRCLQVARMAQQFGVQMGPHHPKRGMARVYIHHFAALVPNLCAFQETRDWEPWEQFEPSFKQMINSEVSVPDGPGWGVDVYKDELKMARPV
jgi:D-galactarolactone cycloisomerase